jgi:hypothetical protein
MADSNYIMVPAGEVRRRADEAVNWYENGGRDGIRETVIARWRQYFRDDVAKGTKGWINKRPLTEAEIEAKVDDLMKHGWDDWGFSAGDTKVECTMSTYDDYYKEMKALSQAATGDYEMQVRTFIWRMIVEHSSEPVAQSVDG